MIDAHRGSSFRSGHHGEDFVALAFPAARCCTAMDADGDLAAST